MCGRDDDTMFYSKKVITLVILAEMKDHFCGLYAVFDGDVQSLEREKLDPNRLKLPNFSTGIYWTFRNS